MSSQAQHEKNLAEYKAKAQTAKEKRQVIQIVLIS